MRVLLKEYYKQIVLEERCKGYRDIINEKIAPHGSDEDELEMMKSGEKPAVLPSTPAYNQLYAPLIDLYKWEVILFKLAGFGDTPFYVIGQPGQRARIERIAEMIKAMNKSGKGADANYHRELGRLLGYSEEDIEHFISKISNKSR